MNYFICYKGARCVGRKKRHNGGGAGKSIRAQKVCQPNAVRTGAVATRDIRH